VNHSSGAFFRLSLGKGEGRVRVRIADPMRWKTPHLSPLPLTERGEANEVVARDADPR